MPDLDDAYIPGSDEAAVGPCSWLIAAASYEEMTASVAGVITGTPTGIDRDRVGAIDRNTTFFVAAALAVAEAAELGKVAVAVLGTLFPICFFTCKVN